MRTAAELEPIDDCTCRLRRHTDTVEWLAFRLTMLGCEFEVHEPPKLADYLRDIGACVVCAPGVRPRRRGSAARSVDGRRTRQA